jgi:hypothetical protein
VLTAAAASYKLKLSLDDERKRSVASSSSLKRPWAGRCTSLVGERKADASGVVHMVQSACQSTPPGPAICLETYDRYAKAAAKSVASVFQPNAIEADV